LVGNQPAFIVLVKACLVGVGLHLWLHLLLDQALVQVWTSLINATQVLRPVDGVLTLLLPSQVLSREYVLYMYGGMMRLGCVVVSRFGLLPPGRALPQLLGIIVDSVLVWRIRYLLCSQLADSEGVVSIDGVVLDAGLVSAVLLPEVH